MSSMRTRTCWRGFILFLVGVLFTVIYRLFQFQKKQGALNCHITTAILSTLMVSTMCGTASALVGLLYPHYNSKSGYTWALPVDWASVLRCMAIYMGINHANAKLDFASNLHLSLTLASMSVGLWWVFDRSRRGFGLGLSTAILATSLTQLLTYSDVYHHIERDFFNIRYHAYSWIPCIFFSGGITIGNLGRQLASGDLWFEHKAHYN